MVSPQRLVAFCLAFLAVTEARPHSFYPYECCSEVDCFPVEVPRTAIERRADGWFLKKEGITVPFEAARPSPDNRFHLCRDERGQGKLITPYGRPPCFWAPEPGG